MRLFYVMFALIITIGNAGANNLSLKQSTIARMQAFYGTLSTTEKNCLKESKCRENTNQAEIKKCFKNAMKKCNIKIPSK